MYKRQVLERAIVADGTRIGENARLGMGEYAESQLDKKVYVFDLVTVGEESYIPPDVTIGKNTAVAGKTGPEDYPDGNLPSGGRCV